jgi:hypothetical protein
MSTVVSEMETPMLSVNLVLRTSWCAAMVRRESAAEAYDVFGVLEFSGPLSRKRSAFSIQAL